MSAAKRVAHAAETIRARWEHNVESDPQTEAAQALEDTCQLLDPEVAAELERLRVERDRYRTAWGRARTRALSVGGAADRYAARARDAQEALQHMFFTVIASQLARKAAADEIAALKAERHSTNESLSEAAEQLRVDRDRIAQLEAQRAALAERLRAGQQWQRGRNPELVSESYVSPSELRNIFGVKLTAPWDEPDYDPCHPCGCPKRFDRHSWGCPTLAETSGAK